MSLEATKAVWERSNARGTEKFVLVAIADCADRHGIAFPSTEFLAAKTGLDVRSIRRIRRALINAGELEEVPSDKKRRSRMYQITTVKPDKLSASWSELADVHDREERTPVSAETVTDVRANGHQCPQERTPVSGAIRMEQSLNSNGTVSEPQGARRFHRVLAFIAVAYEQANQQPLNLSCKEQLSRALFDALDASYPDEVWPARRLEQCVRNRFASDCDNMDPPHRWVSDLYRYRDGPLDRYKQPIKPKQETISGAAEIIGETSGRPNAHQLRTANNLRAAAGAFRYFDELEQAKGGGGSAD